MQLKKIKVVDDNPRGFKNINESDFDAELHELYDENVVTDTDTDTDTDTVETTPRRKRRAGN